MMTKLKAFLVLLALVLLPAVASAQPNGYFFPPHWMYDPTLGALVSPNRILLPDGTAAAPAMGFLSEPATGFYRVGTSSAAYTAAGVPRYLFSGSNFNIISSGSIGFTSGAVVSTSPDTILTRGAANTLYQKNGANPQTFWLANTDDGAGNYERGGMWWEANYLRIGTLPKGGTGTDRQICLVAGGVCSWALSAGGTLYPATNDTFGVGTAGQQAINFYLSRSIQGSKSAALTDNVAKAFVRVAVADDDYEGGTILYTAYAEDTATDARQVTQGEVRVACLNNSGTEACAFSVPAEVSTVTAGTLPCTFSAASAVADTIDLSATCNTSLAATTTLTFEWRMDLQSTATLTPQ
jgi:hypothetical protein